MKIAIVCPIGDLHRCGYWRSAQPCLESWKAVGDLFLIHSSRTVIPFEIQSYYIRDDDTLMSISVDENGTWGEWFDHRLVAANANRGIDAARAMGYDVAVTICVNWYVEEIAAHEISKRCSEMLASKAPCGFLYRRLQIGSRLFESDRMSIAMFNLHQTANEMVKVLVDKADIDGTTILSARGHFRGVNDECYIDCEHELTTAELQQKLSDVRNYEDILPKRNGVDWAYWQDYYRQRALELMASPDALGPIGQIIAARHPSGAFGDWLIEQMATVTA